MTAPYKLTLTYSERGAIDWVGSRYGHGDRLLRVLSGAEWEPDSRDWDEGGEITFHLTEPQAWEMIEIAEEEGHNWTCFAPALAEKLEDFLSHVV